MCICFNEEEGNIITEKYSQRKERMLGPTYLEPGCRYRALSVALIQRDDSDDILSVGLQVGQSVKLAVTSKLHSLHISTFVNNRKIMSEWKLVKKNKINTD